MSEDLRPFCFWCDSRECQIMEDGDYTCKELFSCCGAPKDGRERCDCSYDDWGG